METKYRRPNLFFQPPPPHFFNHHCPTYDMYAMPRSPTSSTPTSHSASPLPQGNTEKSVLGALEEKVSRLEQALEAEKARNKKRKRENNDTVKCQGRPLRRIVHCFEPFLSLIAEADRCLHPDSDSGDDECDGLNDDKRVQLERQRNCNYLAYKWLTRFRPHITDLMARREINGYLSYIAQLQQGANAARADDNSRMIEEVPKWLNKMYSLDGHEALVASHRDNRSLQHDICGMLLTPIDVDWDDTHVRQQIREGRNKDVQGNFFLCCLYPLNKFDPAHLEKNFLKGELLLLTYTAVFITPGVEAEDHLSNDDDDNDSEGRLQKRRKVHKARNNSVSALCGLDGNITGPAIAYSAVMLAFNLTDQSTWAEEHAGIDFVKFYNFLVDYFEAPRTERQKARASSLLHWWNRLVPIAPEDNDPVLTVGQMHLSRLPTKRFLQLRDILQEA
ncbi:hypothetical protein NP233_g11249 [Leucocoprinus birnbaumii]|uniref:Uncharacterized protein n=1 Tax=Leucocoprinus birnbaumii TaxID=56174 RepID=A0AAD5VHQ5_9AGAR|nr:hypothetical protein NP233_g11249 [Leucocoprinus birnbaumii]